MKNDHYCECPNCHSRFHEILRICEHCGFDMDEVNEEMEKEREKYLNEPYWGAIIDVKTGRCVYDDEGNKIEYPSKIKSIFKKSKIKPMVVSD